VQQPKHFKQTFDFLNYILFYATCLTEEQVKTAVYLGYFTKGCGVEEVQFHSFQTVELNGSEWLISRISQIDPRKGTPVPIEYGVGWAPEPVWTFFRKGKSLACV
jgi:hypothetical protein